MGIFSKHCATCKHSKITSCSFDLPEFQSDEADDCNEVVNHASSLSSARSVESNSTTLYCAPSKELYSIIREMQELHPGRHFCSIVHVKRLLLSACRTSLSFTHQAPAALIIRRLHRLTKESPNSNLANTCNAFRQNLMNANDLRVKLSELLLADGFYEEEILTA